MAASGETQRQAFVNESFPMQAGGEAELGHEVDRALFEQAGTDALDDVAAASVLQDDGLDAVATQEMRQQQPGRAGADNSHLGAHRAHRPGSTRAFGFAGSVVFDSRIDGVSLNSTSHCSLARLMNRLSV